MRLPDISDEVLLVPHSQVDVCSSSRCAHSRWRLWITSVVELVDGRTLGRGGATHNPLVFVGAGSYSSGALAIDIAGITRAAEKD